MKRLLLLILRTYQLVLSPILGPRCRFYPSCSHYAMQAIDTFGVFNGSILTLKRVCKCHPLHKGGFDPVPESRKSKVKHTA